MALVLATKTLLRQQIIKICSHELITVSSVFLVNNSFGRFRVLDAFCGQHDFINFQPFSTGSQPESISWECSSRIVLLKRLEGSLKDHRLDEAWLTFNDFKSLYGFPTDTHVIRLITEFSYSSDPRWLQKASDLVFQILKEKSNLVNIELLTKLSLSFARALLPTQSCMILRVMLERENFPQLSILHLIFLHLVKTETGTCLASNFLIQISDHCLKANHGKVKKPDTMIFNLVLDACVRFKSSLKGQMLVEQMARIGVHADAHSITNIARIYEMNGLRDGINKFKDHIRQVSAPFVCQYKQFYDCLLNLHFKFDDFDAAAELVYDINKFFIGKPQESTKQTCFVSIGSKNLRDGLKLQIVPEMLEKDWVIEGGSEKELVISKNGKLLFSNRAVAKLIYGFKRHGRITELTNVLLSLQKNLQTLSGSNLCSDVIDACIYLDWLETAHDILEDAEKSGFHVDSSAYMRLLRAYYGKEMFREAEVLLTQIQKTGLLANLSDVEESGSYSVMKSHLADNLVQEIEEENSNALPTVFYELNSSIYFFCQAKMMEDALKSYRKMQAREIKPTEQTFAYLINGYASVGKFRDMTILWGDIKRNMKSHNIVVSTDLYELLLMKFIQGGYFERVMEIIDYMNERNMCVDKGMCKSEFLKFHRDLYKSLRPWEARTEAQKKRIEFVHTFRKWLGMD